MDGIDGATKDNIDKITSRTAQFMVSDWAVEDLINASTKQTSLSKPSTYHADITVLTGGLLDMSTSKNAEKPVQANLFVRLDNNEWRSTEIPPKDATKLPSVDPSKASYSVQTSHLVGRSLYSSVDKSQCIVQFSADETKMTCNSVLTDPLSAKTVAKLHTVSTFKDQTDTAVTVVRDSTDNYLGTIHLDAARKLDKHGRMTTSVDINTKI